MNEKREAVQKLSKNRRVSIYTLPVLVLIITVGVSYLGLGLVMPLRALYGRQIGASSAEIGLMTTSFLLAGFLATPGIGWLSDRIGYKNVLWIGLLMHAALMIAYIFVQDPVMLIGLRGLEGIASVSVLPPTRAMMNTLAPRERQGEALGLFLYYICVTYHFHCSAFRSFVGSLWAILAVPFRAVPDRGYFLLV